MLNLPYNHEEGPMWRARLFQGVPCTDHNHSAWSLSDVRSTFPNQYHLLLGFHHAPNDGVSVNIIANAAARLLQDVLNSTHIDNSQIGHLIDSKLIMKEEQSVREKLEEDQLQLSKMLREMSMTNQNFKPLLSEAFGKPLVTQPKSKTLQTVLDQSIMKSFQNKCKAAGISVNCGLSSVVDRAMVELVREAGVQRDLYSITGRHAVSERRYIGSGNPFTELGCYLGPMQHTMIGSHKGRHDFWQYAKLSAQQYREGLKQKLLYKDRILRAMLHLQDGNFSYESYYATQPPFICDYYISSLIGSHFLNLNANKQLTSFKITAMLFYFNAINTDYSNMQVFQTFIGRHVHQLIYSTGQMTDEVAERLQQMILKTLRDNAR